MRIKCDFSIFKIDNDKKMIFIKDMDLGRMSVTNDAENVVKYLNEKYPNFRIIYQDSDGLDWDELVHENGKFIKFSFYQEGNYN